LTILREHHSCWRIAHADKASVIVDGADYFRAVKSALLLAERTVFLIGWDFDPRVKFEPGEPTMPGPNEVGKFLKWIAARRPELQIYLLRWRFAAAQALPRITTPLFVLNWITHNNVYLRLAAAHPAGAAHHQKIIVVDDGLAFVGGIDLTTGRWDTRQHRKDDARRRKAAVRDTGPWHDAAMLVDGEAATAVGELARERIRNDSNLEPPASKPTAHWPKEVEPTFNDVEIGIARTLPDRNDRKPAFEVERCVLDAISAAQRTIYIESQYLASARIAHAIAERLEQAEGPEIVLVLPRFASGWLQHKAMDSARTRLLGHLRGRDTHGRFRCYFPVNDRDEPIYVHAKIMVVDNTFLKVGSSNLNNRSLGLDSECDLAIESRRSDVTAAIENVRNGLVAEHLGLSRADEVADTISAKGSLIAAIEALRHPDGRGLRDLPNGDNDAIDSALAENELLDPERPKSLAARLMAELGMNWK